MLRSTLEGNAIGMVVKDNARAVAQDCSFSKNAGAGVQANANLGIGLVEISLEHCVLSHNGGAGVLAGDPSAVAPSDFWLSNNEIVNNVGNGVQISTNGHVFTYTNNRINGNGTDGCAGCAAMSLN